MTIRVRHADIHRSKPVKFLWSNRLVKDNFNLIIGNEGIGKGTLVAWATAQLTRGKLQGSMWKTPITVGIIGDEDDFDSVWTPRIHACSGDLNRVVTLDREDFDQIDIRRDINELADVVQKHDIQVLYFDQFLDNLATDTDHYHAKQVRAALSPLRTVARALSITTIATMHPNKRAETFRQLVQGSSAFNAAARSTLLVAEHPAKEDVRVLVTAKANYSRTGHGLEFLIREVQERPNGYLLKVPKAVSFQPSEMTRDDLVEVSSRGKKVVGVGQHAEAALADLLGDGEWHEASDVYDLMTADGFSERTVRRIGQQMGIQTKKSGFQGGTLWRLARTRE